MSSESRAHMERQAGTLRGLLEQLQGREAEDETGGISEEFQRLKHQSTKYRTDKTFPSQSAENQENVKKNRYKDIMPYDHSRVILSLVTSGADKDYINASFIQGASGSPAYIATQGPLAHTLVDFLRMIWEFDVQVVVMACLEFEMGKKKCERYWPLPDDPPLVCKAFTVSCDSEQNRGEYVTRTLRLTYNKRSRTLKQLHYLKWPDHGIPDSVPAILDLIQEMRSYQAHDHVPLCVHCSAGCGRTGVLCAIDYTWNLLKNQMIPPDFNIYSLVHQMRTQRQSLVQTKEQYILVHEAVRLLFRRYVEHENQEDEEEQHVPSPAPLDDDDDDDVITQQTPGASESDLEPSVFMVEDPYFDPPEGQCGVPEIHLELLGTVEQHLSDPLTRDDCPMFSTDVDDEGAPPPLPERTPESYILAEAGDAAPGQNLSLHISLCDVTAGAPPSPVPPLLDRTPESFVLAQHSGAPPSPVPPLPDRTPESFVLAQHSDDFIHGSVNNSSSHQQDYGYVNLDRVGSSSEWSGSLSSCRPESASWTRSKSLRVKLASPAAVNHPNRSQRPAVAPPPPPSPHPVSLTPPLPERSTDSYFLQTQNSLSGAKDDPQVSAGVHRPLDSSAPGQQGQSRTMLDVVFTPSRNVPARTFRPESQIVFSSAVNGQEASAMNRRSSLNMETSNATSTQKTFSRAKSLRLFLNKNKSKAQSPAAATPSPRPFLSSVFKLGFGIRVAKPKGPRKYPDSWF